MQEINEQPSRREDTVYSFHLGKQLLSVKCMEDGVRVRVCVCVFRLTDNK